MTAAQANEFRRVLLRGYPMFPGVPTAEQTAAYARVQLKAKYDFAAEFRSRRRSVILPLDQLRALPPVVAREVSGVYFLWRGPRLVYVGSGNCVRERYMAHLRRMPESFTHGTFVAAHRQLIRELETAYIRGLLPALNIRMCA